MRDSRSRSRSRHFSAALRATDRTHSATLRAMRLMNAQIRAHRPGRGSSPVASVTAAAIRPATACSPFCRAAAASAAIRSASAVVRVPFVAAPAMRFSAGVTACVTWSLTARVSACARRLPKPKSSEVICSAMDCRRAWMLPGVAHLSMSPTTKNIEPRIATMSATSVPGSSTASAWMLL